MHRVARLLLIIFILMGFIACAPVPPAEMQIPPAAPVATGQLPAEVFNLAPLDSPQVQSDLVALLELQASRTPSETALIRKWHSQPVVAWNEQARYWVSYYGMDPVVASRVYALTSVAQQRALDSFAQAGMDFSARKPELLSDALTPIEIPVDSFESAILIGATEPVFVAMFVENPKEIAAVFEEAREALQNSGTILPGDLEAAEAFGAGIANELIKERSEDGASKARDFDPLPTGVGIWKPDPFRVKPEQPNWGKVLPWLMTSPDQFRAPPPPEFGSVAFQSALDEVRQQQASNTQGQLAIAQKWADKRFTYTPPGHWNLIAIQLIQEYDLPSLDSTHVLSALNMAQMDAGIACWDSKYFYLVVRPWQADPSIAGLVGYPNHPSYPSGHSCFSGASAETLSYFFPAERERLWQMAEEASLSRLYAGIHYHFDVEAGRELGRQAGDLAKLYATRLEWDPYAP